MKKLWISIGLALGLLAAPAMTMAQEGGAIPPKPTAPLSMYAYQSTANTFYDLATLNDDNELPADNAGRFMFMQPMTFGTDLEKGTSLQNLFIVANKKAFAATNPDENEPQYSLVTLDPNLAVDATERHQLAIPLQADLGLTHFCGQDVSGFAIAAIGGILFSDATKPAEGYSLPGITCQNADCMTEDAAQNFLRVRPLDWNASTAAIGLLNPTKGDKAPVIMAFAMDNVKMQLCLWVQFDYMVGDMNWVFQIRYYADGQSDFIIKTLGTAEQLTSLNYRFTPVVLRNKDNHTAIQNARDKDYNSTNWNVIQSGTFSAWNGMVLSNSAIPAEGQTLSVIPPFNSTAFSLTETDLTTDRLIGKVALDPAITPTAASEVINSICVLLSKTNPVASSNNPPFKTSAPLTVGDKLGSGDNEYIVAYTGKPTIGNTPVNLAFNVNNLTHNTEYHVSVFLGYFNENAENAYFYSKPLAAWMTKTKRDGLQGLDATNVTDGKSTISIEPAAGLSTMLVKSDKATAPTGLTGKLEVGSSLGTDGTVITILNTDVTTYELTTDIEPGQGFYLHGYTVKDAESATPTYGAYPYSTTVYRPSESLPLAWGPFTTDQASPATTDLPLLVPGWHHDEASSATSAFKFGRPYITAGYIDALMLYADGQDITASIITPAFIPNARRVKATFMTYCSFQAGNSINLEYRENGGDWKQIEQFTEFPEPDESGLRPISAMFNCHSKAIIEIRYTASITAYYTLAVASAEVEAEATDITCFPPTGLTIDTADVTDTQLALHWSDDDNETASYTVAFQATDADSWTLTGTAEKTVKLTGLNPNTAYRMQVQAVCAADDSSAFGNPVVFATYAGIPYTESLGNLYSNPDDPFDYESPEDRGVRTYVGKIGETLTPETTPTYTWAARHSANGMLNQNERAMGIHEDILNAALVLPPVYTQTPTLLSFTLNSFDASEKDESYIPQIVRGATPTEEDCRLYVAVSDNGLFTPEDVILTLTGAELNLIDTVFELETDKTGAIQIAFFFDNPVAHWEDKFHLEVYNLGLTLVPQEYTLTLNATPVDGGTVTGAGRHKENSDVTITATANEDYDFVAWMNGSVELSKTASYTFKMPAEDVAYTAVFKSNKPVVEPEEYELTLIASPANGGRVGGDGSYLADEDVTISAEANQGYKFVAWVNGNDTLSKEAVYTFKMPAKDTTFTARFVQDVANEASLRASFALSTKDGNLHIRNLNGLTIKIVEIYGLTGNRINRFAPNSREDLILAVDAERALLFVRLDTENGAAVYKVYLQ